MALRILVVDDEPDILDLITIWLEDDPRCKAVERASTLLEAMQVAELTCPDVILLDFRLGHQNSASALPRLRASCPSANILIHTASRDEAVAAQVLALGADAILEKATVSIAAVVEAVLDQAGLGQAAADANADDSAS
jgi:DNA-binding NarL/FixJ family response regulator